MFGSFTVERSRGRGPALVAAGANGLIVTLAPYLWGLYTGPGSGASVNVTPGGVQHTFDPIYLVTATLGVFVAFRTLAHAMNYLEGAPAWTAVVEPAVPGTVLPLLMLPSLVRTRDPYQAVLYVAAYVLIFGGGGLVIGIVLRFTAVGAIHLAGGRRGSVRPQDDG